MPLDNLLVIIVEVLVGDILEEKKCLIAAYLDTVSDGLQSGPVVTSNNKHMSALHRGSSLCWD